MTPCRIAHCGATLRVAIHDAERRATLKQGESIVRRVGYLFERIVERDNLREAFHNALRRKRDRPEARAFAENLEANLTQLAGEILSGRWRPAPFHQFTIHVPKERLISAPCFRDRVAHHAIMRVCDPVFERVQIAHSYACRVGKGRVAAVEYAQKKARQFPFFLKMDVRKYFDSIAHDILLRKLARLFKDQRLIELFEVIIRHYATQGVPIGSLTSQHFANFFLTGIDHFALEGRWRQETRRGSYARYMDDFAVWSDSADELQEVQRQVAEQLSQLGLALKANSFINRTPHGMNWLGYRVFPDRITLNRRSRVRFKTKLDFLETAFLAGEIDEATLQRRAQAMIAFTLPAGREGWRFRQRVLQCLLVSDQRPRTE